MLPWWPPLSPQWCFNAPSPAAANPRPSITSAAGYSVANRQTTWSQLSVHSTGDIRAAQDSPPT